MSSILDIDPCVDTEEDTDYTALSLDTGWLDSGYKLVLPERDYLSSDDY